PLRAVAGARANRDGRGHAHVAAGRRGTAPRAPRRHRRPAYRSTGVPACRNAASAAHLSGSDVVNIESARRPAPERGASAGVSAEQVMQWLHAVPDPEIPVISIVDLGIVRHIDFDDDACVVTITPTYSGCPAMREIGQDIERVLKENGMTQVRVEKTLTPAWTTDWMSERGKNALRDYGIAPPAERAVDISGLSRRNDPPVACPQC